MFIIDTTTLFPVISVLFLSAAALPLWWKKRRSAVISESRRREIENELLAEEKPNLKKTRKLKSAELNAAADALVAQVARRKMEREDNENDVLTLISIQNPVPKKEVINKVKSFKLSKIKKVVPLKVPETDERPAVAKAEAPDIFQESETLQSNVQETWDPHHHKLMLTDIDGTKFENVQSALEIQQTQNKLLKTEFKMLQDANNVLSQSVTQAQESARKYEKEVLQLQTKLQVQLQNNEMLKESLKILQVSSEDVIKEKDEFALRINELMEIIAKQNSGMDKSRKDWLLRIQTVQETSSNQILTLSAEFDAMQREWRNKVDILDAELKRERYEKDSKSLQLKLKQVQCEKSDVEAFNAKSQIARLQEELKLVRNEREKSSSQLLDAKKNISKLQRSLSSEKEINFKLKEHSRLNKELIRQNKILDEKIDKQMEEISKQKKEIKNQNSLILELTQSISETKLENETLKSQLKAANKHISANDGAMVEISAKIVNQEANIVAFESEIEKLDSL